VRAVLRSFFFLNGVSNKGLSVVCGWKMHGGWAK
jgi:hypothetical protein